MFNVRTSDTRDQRDLGAQHLGQRRDFARMIGADLENAIHRLGTQRQQTQRQPDLVVQIAACGTDRTAAAAERGRHLFDGGFPGTAGDPHNTRRLPQPPGARGFSQRSPRVGHADQRPSDRLFGCAPRLLHQRRNRPLLKGLRHKIVTVKTLAAQGDIETARRHLPRVLRHAAEGRRQRLRVAACPCGKLGRVKYLWLTV